MRLEHGAHHRGLSATDLLVVNLETLGRFAPLEALDILGEHVRFHRRIGTHQFHDKEQVGIFGNAFKGIFAIAHLVRHIELADFTGLHTHEALFPALNHKAHTERKFKRFATGIRLREQTETGICRKGRNGIDKGQRGCGRIQGRIGNRHHLGNGIDSGLGILLRLGLLLVLRRLVNKRSRVNFCHTSNLVGIKVVRKAEGIGDSQGIRQADLFGHNLCTVQIHVALVMHPDELSCPNGVPGAFLDRLDLERNGKTGTAHQQHKKNLQFRHNISCPTI